MSPELVVEVLRGCNGSVEAATEALFAMLQGARAQPAASAGQGSSLPAHSEACTDEMLLAPGWSATVAASPLTGQLAGAASFLACRGTGLIDTST